MNYLKNLTSGRLGRTHFFGAAALKIILLILVGLLFDYVQLSDDVLWQKIIAWFILGALWFFGYSTTLRRCHDMEWNKLGSIVTSLILGLPFIWGGLFLLYVAVMPGTEGPNKYGEPDTGNFLSSVFVLKF